jgi:hypothetical protein
MYTGGGGWTVQLWRYRQYLLAQRRFRAQHMAIRRLIARDSEQLIEMYPDEYAVFCALKRITGGYPNTHTNQEGY